MSENGGNAIDCSTADAMRESQKFVRSAKGYISESLLTYYLESYDLSKSPFTVHMDIEFPEDEFPEFHKDTGFDVLGLAEYNHVTRLGRVVIGSWVYNMDEWLHRLYFYSHAIHKKLLQIAKNESLTRAIDVMYHLDVIGEKPRYPYVTGRRGDGGMRMWDALSIRFPGYELVVNPTGNLISVKW